MMHVRSVLGPIVLLIGTAAMTTHAEARQFASATLLEKFAGGNDTYTVAPLTVGDVNADGFDDLLIRAATTRLWLGGLGGLTGPITTTGLPPDPSGISLPVVSSGAPRRTALARIDADAFPDALISASSLSLWKGDGAGGFSQVQSLPGIGGDLLVLDIDLDGDLDVLSDNGQSLRILRNDFGTLQPADVFSFGVGHRTRAGRFSNGPGPDLIYADSLLLNDGAGRFTRVVRPELTAQPKVFALLDINADGFDDLLMNDSIAPFPANPIDPWWSLFSPNYLPGVMATSLWTPSGFSTPIAFVAPFAGRFTAVELPSQADGTKELIVAPVGGVSTFTNSPAQFARLGVKNGVLLFDAAYATEGLGTADIAAGQFDSDSCTDVVAYSQGLFSGFTSVQGSLASGTTLFRGTCDRALPFHAPPTVGFAFLGGSTNNYISRLVAADFNADGLVDLVAIRPTGSNAGSGTNSGTNRVLFFRNLGGGRFDFSKPVFFIGSDTPFRAVESMDFNNDGAPEAYGVATGLVPLQVRPIADTNGLALPMYWDQTLALTAGTPIFALPSPTAGYSTSTNSGISRAPNGVNMTFDATGDGVPDFVWFQNYRSITNTTQPSRIVVQSAGLPDIVTTTPTRLAAVAPFDFDNDGDTDLIGIERASTAPANDCTCISWTTAFAGSCNCAPSLPMKVFMNNGTGVFTPMDTTIPVGTFSDNGWPELRIGDVTGEGWPDVVLFSPGSAELRVFPGTPAGMSPTPSITPTGAGVYQTVLADIDRDRDLDIIGALDYYVTGAQELVFPEHFAVFRNNGAGAFTRDDDASPLSTTVPFSPAIADFDSDGDSDLAFVKGSSALIALALNRTPPACSADFNNDGVVSTTDLVFFLGRFGQTATPGSPAARADFNNNGVVDTPDLVFFLGRFGETCPL